MIARVLCSDSHLGTIWSMLHDEGVVENLDVEQCTKVKAKMYELAKHFAIDDTSVGLLSKSKKLIDVIIPYVAELRLLKTNSNMKKDNSSPRQYTVGTQPSSVDASAETLKARNREIFDQELEQRRLEFEKLVSVKIPEQPNFEDDRDSSSGNVSDLLKAFQEDRDKQLRALQ